MLKRILLTFAFILLFCCGCIVTPLKHRPDDSAPVKIGVLIPASSAESEQVQQFQSGIEFAAEELNSGNGVNGRSVELLYRPTGNSPERACQAIHDLDKAGVSAVILGGTSAEIRTVLPLQTECQRKYLVIKLRRHRKAPQTIVAVSYVS